MEKIKWLAFILIVFSLISCNVLHAQVKLKKEILGITQTIGADVGVGVKHLETGDTLSVNGHNHFPMQSVFKFHLGLAVLAEVDHGKLTIDQKIFIEKKRFTPKYLEPPSKDLS